MHAEALDDFRRPMSHTMLDRDHRSPNQLPRPMSNGMSPTSRPSIHNPSQVEVKLEAIDRIQTQVSLNRASLENSARDIKKATEHIRRLEDGFNQLSRSYTEHFERLQTDLLRQIESFKHQLAATTGKTGAGGEQMDDHTLEMLTRNLAAVSDKANKVDSMELDMQLMKRRMAKLEEQMGSVSLTTGRESAAPTSAGHSAQTYQQQQSPQAYGSVTSAMSRQNSDLPHQTLPEPRSHVDTHSNRWTTVAQALKRSTAEPSLDLSPKRTKLAPLEPRLTARSTNSDDDIHRPRVEPSSRYPDIKSITSFGSQHDGHKDIHHSLSRYDSPPSSSFHNRDPYGQPNKQYRPDGLPRPMITPGWPDSAHREALIDGQLVNQGADGQYYAVPESSYSSDRRTPLVTGPGSMNSKDPYAHTKKTRTKPVRNSDGILIRKDGKPDMRSQSSAANLRKVHARKEEQRAGESGWHGSPDSNEQDSPSRAQSIEAADSPSNIMLQHSESTGSSLSYHREDSRRSDNIRMASNPYINSTDHQRSRDISSDTSPRSMHRSSLDTDRPNSSSHSITTASTGPERRPLTSVTLQAESPRSYRPPTLPTPVSMQFKQPEVSMLTKQEVA